MCCRTTISPLDLQAAQYVLEHGLFVPTYKPEGDHEGHVPTVWERKLPDEGTVVTVSLGNGVFVLSISPSISHYNHHAGKRVAAGVCFEIAARYAEKVGGHIIQKSVVSGCYTPGEPHDLDLAQYPEVPLLFDHICNGFRELIMGETAH